MDIIIGIMSVAGIASVVLWIIVYFNIVKRFKEADKESISDFERILKLEREIELTRRTYLLGKEYEKLMFRLEQRIEKLEEHFPLTIDEIGAEIVKELKKNGSVPI